MCRFLMMRADTAFETADVLATFRGKCRESVEYQGHGWGAAWRAAGTWSRHKSLTPIWEDRFEIPKEVDFLIVHARSAFKDTGITIENNMPFYHDERAFVFNGEAPRRPASRPGTYWRRESVSPHRARRESR